MRGRKCSNNPSRKRHEEMNSPQTFWRLLRDYERLTSDETTALRNRDFEAVASAESLKPVLFSALREIGAALGYDRSDPVLRNRLELLAIHERANLAFVGKLLAQAASERRNLNALLLRLRGIDHTYAVAGARAEAFFAQG